MQNGHYKSFVRVKDDWFLFDDAKVTKVDGLGFGHEGYMFFYQKCFMDYVDDLYE
jgi:ubiquitin C-terminal hydrolase